MIFTILFLALAAAIIALLIYWVMTSFRVEEDPRIGEVQEALPGANCGNCGYPAAPPLPRPAWSMRPSMVSSAPSEEMR